MTNPYENMNIKELEQKLLDLKEEIEDAEEEKKAVLGQMGIHITGSTVDRYDAEINGIKKRIASIENILHKKQAQP